MAQSRADDSFRTWALYKPPSNAGLATAWVPVQKYSWFWGGTAQHIKQGDFWTANWLLAMRHGATVAEQPTDTEDFPKWDYYINWLVFEGKDASV